MTRINNKFLIILGICLSLLVLGNDKMSVAQTLPFGTIDLSQFNDFQIEFNPKYPGANTSVRAKIISYTFDTDISTITWVLNGQTIAQGKGEKSIEFKTGDIGSSIDLSISVITEKSQRVQKRINFTVGDVDLLWQAMTNTPAFYKGKAIPTSGSEIKLTAITNGLGKSQNLIYEWRRNFQNVPSASGVGKNSYTFRLSDIYGQEVVRVRVSGPDKAFSIEKTIVIKPKQPEVLLYEMHPFEGPLYRQALGKEIDMGDKSEIAIMAEPFFFPKPDIPSLTYNWTLNRNPLESLDQPNIIGLSTTEDDQSGRAQIILEINNPQKLIQKLTKSLTINF